MKCNKILCRIIKYFHNVSARMAYFDKYSIKPSIFDCPKRFDI